ncbi:MAG: globin [Ornithinimicrobium sp.]
MSEPADAVPETETYYERVGGRPTFEALVAQFYRGVATDPDLRALYPEEDLAPAEHRLLMFLEQYWGGPKTYSEQRGHPRLRMRHAPFAVTPAQRDRWLTHMHAAIDSVELSPMDAELMRGYMNHAANFMVNAFED